MEELVKNLPTLLVVSIDMYLTYKTLKIFQWLWKDELPPDRRMMTLNKDRMPMKLEVKNPKMEWSCLTEPNNVYFPEGDPDRGAPINKYADVYWGASKKKNPMNDLDLLPSPSEFVPPKEATRFRIACRPYNEDVNWCYKIDYLRQKNIDVISYMSDYAKTLYDVPKDALDAILT